MPDIFNVMLDNPPDEHGVEWSRQLFDTMAQGGSWAVKRSGLIFLKVGGKLLLTARMPHMEDMPITAEQLKTQQNTDVAIITRYFKAAGIEVEDISHD